MQPCSSAYDGQSEVRPSPWTRVFHCTSFIDHGAVRQVYHELPCNSHTHSISLVEELSTIFQLVPYKTLLRRQETLPTATMSAKEDAQAGFDAAMKEFTTSLPDFESTFKQEKEWGTTDAPDINAWAHSVSCLYLPCRSWSPTSV